MQILSSFGSNLIIALTILIPFILFVSLKKPFLPIIGSSVAALIALGSMLKSFINLVNLIVQGYFSFSSLALWFFGFIADIGLILLAAVALLWLFPKTRKLAAFAGFLPAAVYIFGDFIYTVISLIALNGYSPAFILLQLILYGVMVFTAIAFISQKPKRSEAESAEEKKPGDADAESTVIAPPNASASSSAPEGYISMGAHIPLTLFLAPVWFFIWIYRTTNTLNRVKSAKEHSAIACMFMCMFVPFYTIYWTAEKARRIDILSHSLGHSVSIFTPCLLLAIFMPIVPLFIMQATLNNALLEERSAPVEHQKEAIEDAFSNVHDERTLNEIRRYKELLDQGVITQDEFSAKKKQLLGI